MLTEQGATTVANALKNEIAKIQLDLSDGTTLTQDATVTDVNISYTDNTAYFDVSATFDFTDYQSYSMQKYKLLDASDNALVETSCNVSLQNKTTEEVVVRVKIAFV